MKRPVAEDCVALGGPTTSTDTRWPTRCPHRAQKTSTPLVYDAPHCAQPAPSVIVDIRPPQWPQKGSPAFTDFVQRGQLTSETRVFGTADLAPSPDGGRTAPVGTLIGCG